MKFANQNNLPFLAFNGAHGAITTLGKMDHGIEIYLNQLSSVKIAEDGKTAKFGGGTMSKLVTDTLWAAGKQTGECIPNPNPDPNIHMWFAKSWHADLTLGDSDWNV